MGVASLGSMVLVQGNKRTIYHSHHLLIVIYALGE